MGTRSRSRGVLKERGGRIKRIARPIMWQEHPAKWIIQCTYWHLLKELVKPVSDPNVIVVRGFIDRSGIPVQGQLFPAYQLFGVVDLEAGNGGDWAIVLRDAAGSALSRFPFSPEFFITDPDEEMDEVSFGYRVAALPETTQIDLVGPGYVLVDSGLLQCPCPYRRHQPHPERWPSGAPASRGDGPSRVDGERCRWR